MSTDSLSDSGHPVKRARLESHESVHEPIVDVLEHEDDDLEDADLYGTSDQAAAIPAAADKPQQSTPDRSTLSTANLNSISVSKSPEIPGLFMGTTEPAQEAVQAVPIELPAAPESTIARTTEDYVPFETEADQGHDEAEEDTNMGEAPHEAEDTKPEDDGAQDVTTEAAPMEDAEHVAEEASESKVDEADVQLQQEAQEDRQSVPVDETPAATLSDTAQPEVKKDESEQTTAELLSSMFAPKPAEARSKPAPDPEFLAAAEAQKDDENAEWRFDSSDAESSDSDSSDDSSDEDSDEEYSKMKPEEIAKLLLKEIDEDGDRSAPGPLRTKNEVPEEEVKVERPAIDITDSIKIEPLGFVDSIVGVMVLIKATTSGNQRVLSEGSLLVTEDRKVVGTIADTLGRVEEPLYTVRFNSAAEMEELTIEVGRKIFYVPEHSTYVFTQPLLAQKGSDASNIHDEEVGDGDAEFSDDEQEMEHKRRQKEARRNTSLNKNPAPPGAENKQHQQQKKRPHGGPAPVITDEPYVPLQRPANLHELLSQPPPPPPSSLNRGGHRGDRGGRGRGGNRGNDRGGRGGRGGRGRDGNRGGRGRGGDNHQQNQRNPQQQQQQQPHNAPNKPSQYQQPPAQQAQNPHQAPPPTPQFNFQQPPQFPPLPGFPNFQLPPFNGVPPPPPPNFPMVPNMPGAHVNPTFFDPGAPQQNQQQQQQQQAYNWMQAFTQAQQQPVAPPPVAAPQQNTQSSADAFRALQNTLDMLRQKPPAPQ